MPVSSPSSPRTSPATGRGPASTSRPTASGCSTATGSSGRAEVTRVGRAPRAPCCRESGARDRVVAGGVDRAAGDVDRVVAGRPGGARRGRSPSASCAVAATRWGTRRGCSSCPRAARWPQRPLPDGYALATGDTAGARAGGLRGDPGRVRRVGGAGAGVLRGLGGDDGAPARCPAVAAARRRARRGRSWGPRSRSWTARASGYVDQLAVERTAPRAGDWPRRCSPTRSAGPASTVRRAASCRPTHAPERSTSTSRSAWRSPRCGRTW